MTVFIILFLPIWGYLRAVWVNKEFLYELIFIFFRYSIYYAFFNHKCSPYFTEFVCAGEGVHELDSVEDVPYARFVCCCFCYHFADRRNMHDLLPFTCGVEKEPPKTRICCVFVNTIHYPPPYKVFFSLAFLINTCLSWQFAVPFWTLKTTYLSIKAEYSHLVSRFNSSGANWFSCLIKVFF